MLSTGRNDGLPVRRMWGRVCKEMSHLLCISHRACFLDRGGMKTELCCLLDEGVLEFDGELSVGLEVREEGESSGRELVERLARVDTEALLRVG